MLEERFTEKAKENYYTRCDYNVVTEVPGDEEAMQQYANNKLGRLEDMEEDLGIDFKTFIKAMLNGIYIKVYDEILDFTNCVGWLWRFSREPGWEGVERPLEFHFDIVYRDVKSFYLKDYGKTWALTKEELE